MHQHEYYCTYDKYCSTCGELLEANAGSGTSVKYEPHKWKNGACSECGAACPSHDLSKGFCSTCYMVCPHEEYVNGQCDTCGEGCPSHDLTGGSCSACGMVCGHGFRYDEALGQWIFVKMDSLDKQGA